MRTGLKFQLSHFRPHGLGQVTAILCASCALLSSRCLCQRETGLGVGVMGRDEVFLGLGHRLPGAAHRQTDRAHGGLSHLVHAPNFPSPLSNDFLSHSHQYPLESRDRCPAPNRQPWGDHDPSILFPAREVTLRHGAHRHGVRGLRPASGPPRALPSEPLCFRPHTSLTWMNTQILRASDSPKATTSLRKGYL